MPTKTASRAPLTLAPKPAKAVPDARTLHDLRQPIGTPPGGGRWTWDVAKQSWVPWTADLITPTNPAAPAANTDRSE